MPCQKNNPLPLSERERQPSVARVRRVLASILDHSSEPWRFCSVLVACSGGADSSTLLDALAYLGKSRQIRVEVAHVDHGLRPESAGEADLVRVLSQERGVPFHQLSVGVVAGKGDSVQNAARAARMGVLERLAGERNCDVIAFGHTADDQAETVLMRVLDGATPGALCGILPRSGMRIHPMLGIWRRQTEAYCRAMGIHYLDDPSNENRRYRRVRIRKEVMPVLESISPGAKRRLVVLGARMAYPDQRDLASRVPRERDS